MLSGWAASGVGAKGAHRLAILARSYRGATRPARPIAAGHQRPEWVDTGRQLQWEAEAGRGQAGQSILREQESHDQACVSVCSAAAGLAHSIRTGTRRSLRSRGRAGGARAKWRNARERTY